MVIKTNDDELVMYIIINDDLKMSKGKIAAQAAHVAVKATLNATSKLCTDLYPQFKEWILGSYTKIVLKADTKLLENLIEHYGIHNEEEIK